MIQTLKTERLEIAYRISGEGFPVVLIHGWPESSLCWEGMLPHMKVPGKFIRPDLRGLGNSSREGNVAQFTKLELAKDVISLLNALKVDKFALVGHDWGGAVAQEIAFLEPARVVHLTLMNIPLINNPAGLAAGKKKLDSYVFDIRVYQYIQQFGKLAEFALPLFRGAWLNLIFRGVPHAPLKEYKRAYEIPGTITAGANYYRAMALDFKHWQDLLGRKFTMPAKLIFGILDPIVVKEYLEDYQASFSNTVSLTELYARHFVQEEMPGEVAEALSEALSVFVKDRS